MFCFQWTHNNSQQAMRLAICKDQSAFCLRMNNVINFLTCLKYFILWQDGEWLNGLWIIEAVFAMLQNLFIYRLSLFHVCVDFINELTLPGVSLSL